MEEVVRAFNYVIERGWVCNALVPFFPEVPQSGPLTGLLLGDIWMEFQGNRRSFPSACSILHRWYPWTRIHTTDVADKLGLMGPIAEQCQHKYVYDAQNLHKCPIHLPLLFKVCSIVSAQKRNTRKCIRKLTFSAAYNIVAVPARCIRNTASERWRFLPSPQGCSLER
jgi:hypothetical protein